MDLGLSLGAKPDLIELKVKTSSISGVREGV